MAIEKMELVNIAGLVKDLDSVLLKCCQSECFHIERALHSTDNNKGLVELNEENPYMATLKKIISISSNLSINLGKQDYSDLDITSIEEFNEYIDEVQRLYSEYNQELQMYLQHISEQEQAIQQLQHLSGLTANFEQIFALEHVKVRVGRLPVDSYRKLEYYEDKPFFFVPFESNNSYYWGIYFSPTLSVGIVDDIFKSLYFERIRVPDFVKGTPEKAYEEINNTLLYEKKEVAKLNNKITDLTTNNAVKLSKVFTRLKFLSDTFEYRKMVASINGKFYLMGFIPKIEEKEFMDLFEEIPSVSVLLKPPDVDTQVPPPTKLKNGFFAKPFTMLVEMYGLPSYNDINPTAYFAISYTLLFGLMFGDLGQGLVLFLLGLFITKKAKNSAGGILSRIGLSSMLFGFMYGSVFGFETALDPLYELIGMKGKPIEVFHQTNLILLGAVALGAVFITISIILNIILGFRQKNYEKALFGPNGLAGLTFYLSSVIGAALTLGMNIKVFTTPYILFLVVLPLIIIFFRVPLSNVVKYKKTHVGEDREGIGEFIAENFFEMFEFLLGYITNTMSFLRVGGFILSHAGMMLVVMTLSEGVSKGASPFVVIFGNVFVMALEGMIVGIQAIRLEYYEIFSRFYEADGKPFVTIGVNYDTNIE